MSEIIYRMNPANCGSCSSTSQGLCEINCLSNAIKWVESFGEYVPKIDTDACAKCGMCYSVCSFDAVDKYIDNKLQR